MPGIAIRDGVNVRLAEKSEEDAKFLNILIGDDNLLQFFRINPLAGKFFTPISRTFQEEQKIFYDQMQGYDSSDKITEEYIINRKASSLLGFDDPADAVGKQLILEHQVLAYIKNGTICGVVEDFNYTTVFEDSIPLLIMNRKNFLFCIMVRLQKGEEQKGLETFNRVWNEINPDYPDDYVFMQDIYAQIYHNEMNAEALIRIFSLLCLIIANLGLIIFMAFIIKCRTKEIGIRKVNGATSREIVRMLNTSFITWIAISFVIALPFSYLVMSKWLEHFVRKTTLDWWIFALAGVLVLFISIICISWQSWRASIANPVEAVKSE